MITIRPVPRALVPVDSAAASRLSAPNYDEFQSDDEVREFLAARPESILRVTMPHCARGTAADPDRPEAPEDSPEALELAAERLEDVLASDLSRVVPDVLYIYEIRGSSRPDVRQIGLGGFVSTGEILTEENPSGTIIRNEGIRESKAKGRAELIRATGSYIGTVNLAVRDPDGTTARGLEAIADQRECDFEAVDEKGFVHRIWLIADEGVVRALTDRFAEIPAAYVADGNHRSAAAAMLGYDHFLAVIFTVERMGLAPYNRLVADTGKPPEQVLEELGRWFWLERLGDLPAYAPERVHDIGLYRGGVWHRLAPRPEAFDAANAAASIDADIVQQRFFRDVLGISDPKDERIHFVGGNKDSAWLKARVDAGEHAWALSLAPVEMTQFVDVCEQRRLMPPKSTWFEPKLRSGMVAALLR